MIKTKIPTPDDLLSKAMTQADAKLRVNNFFLTLLDKRSLFLKEAKGLRRKENSKVIEVVEKVTRGPMLSLMLRSKQNKSFAIIARNRNIKDLNVFCFEIL